MQNGYLDVLNSFRLNEFEYGSPPWPAPFRGLCHDLFKYIIHVRLNKINNAQISPAIWTTTANYKQLSDEVFVISGIIKVEVRVISRSRRLRLITLTETLIIPDITKTESNNCFIILYLQVISQFLAGSMKRIEKPFLLCCPRTWHCCPCTWHCPWKSCIACATYRLFTNL